MRLELRLLTQPRHDVILLGGVPVQVQALNLLEQGVVDDITMLALQFQWDEVVLFDLFEGLRVFPHLLRLIDQQLRSLEQIMRKARVKDLHLLYGGDIDGLVHLLFVQGLLRECVNSKLVIYLRIEVKFGLRSIVTRQQRLEHISIPAEVQLVLREANLRVWDMAHLLGSDNTED